MSVENDVYVVKDLERPLLSRYDSQSLNLINKVETVNKVESNQGDYKAQIIEKYPKLFKGLGQIPGEYSITLKDHATPFALTVPRKVPLPLLSKTKAEIERMLDLGGNKESGSAHRMVCSHGSGTKGKWPSQDLC